MAMKLSSFLWVGLVQAWMWNVEETPRTLGLENIPTSTFHSHDDKSPLPNIYAVAIKELQDLESEPLCHRTAARLLVNDCQVLEGKDEATVINDSGRQVRDFVDFYAASLAICDLERGSFTIPAECIKFREASLALLPAPGKPGLHVSSKEIDACLAALAKSDSAWNTWVSYRHKALRFCDAARADNEKTQSIHLYRRITEVLETLVNRVDEEMETRMRGFDQRVREAGNNLNSLKPNIGQLHEGLAELQEMLSDQLKQTAENSARALHRGLEHATSLQQALSVLLSSVLEGNAEMASSHDKAIGTIKARTNEGLGIITSALVAITTSSSALEEQMKQAHQVVMELEDRQGVLERGLATSIDLVQILSARFEAHDKQLSKATEKTATLMETLDDATTIATKLQSSIGIDYGISRWWPYVVFPVVSLVLGSYRLPPSGIRNLGLVVLGEGLGLVVWGVNELAKSHLQLPDYTSYGSIFFGPNMTGSMGPMMEMQHGMVETEIQAS